MSNVYKKLAQGTLGTSPAVLYTVPSGSQAVIRKITLASVSSSDCWAKLFDGGSADGNVILPQVTIDANGFAEWTGGAMTLFGGGTIEGVAEAASSITYTIYGMEKS